MRLNALSLFMKKWVKLLKIAIFYGCLTNTSFAYDNAMAIRARDEALRALQGFNPVTVLPEYTQTPKESSLHPQEGSNDLSTQGQSALQSNHAANEVYQEAKTRTPAPYNPSTPELSHAEKILEAAETASEPECQKGLCDNTVPESSDDIGEGVSKLGALSGASTDVSNNQVGSGMPSIFKGTSYECRKYPLGFRDCCTGSGWGDWVKHCPQDLQVLQRAKAENRVVFLGGYKRHKYGAHHYSYCIFPNKLAGIVQVQGRGGQLGISFGQAKYPNCRGITPEELSNINFAALDLTAIQQELIARMVLPGTGSIQSTNQAHIEKLKQMEKPHD